MNSSRGSKMVVALGLTLALHALVAIYALGPRLSGLTKGTAGSTDVAVPAPKALPEPAAPPAAGQKTAAEPEPPLEVSLLQAPAVVAAPAEQKTVGDTPAKMEKQPAPPADKPAAERPAVKPVETPAVKTVKPAAASEKPATAPPARPAAVVKPPASGGNGGSAAGPVLPADSSYANRVRQHLAKFAGALPPGANGEARVQFVVQPDGRVSEVHLVKFSGNTALDTVALKLPTAAQPLPLPGATAQRLEVPVQATAAGP